MGLTLFTNFNILRFGDDMERKRFDKSILDGYQNIPLYDELRKAINRLNDLENFVNEKGFLSINLEYKYLLNDTYFLIKYFENYKDVLDQNLKSKLKEFILENLYLIFELGNQTGWKLYEGNPYFWGGASMYALIKGCEVIGEEPPKNAKRLKSGIANRIFLIAREIRDRYKKTSIEQPFSSPNALAGMSLAIIIGIKLYTQDLPSWLRWIIAIEAVKRILVSMSLSKEIVDKIIDLQLSDGSWIDGSAWNEKQHYPYNDPDFDIYTFESPLDNADHLQRIIIYDPWEKRDRYYRAGISNVYMEKTSNGLKGFADIFSSIDPSYSKKVEEAVELAEEYMESKHTKLPYL